MPVGETRRLAYSPSGQVLWESDPSGEVLVRYVHVGRMLAAMVLADGRMFFHHLDDRASVVALTDAAGAVVNAYRYGPFGEVAHRREAVAGSAGREGPTPWQHGCGEGRGDGRAARIAGPSGLARGPRHVGPSPSVQAPCPQFRFA